MQQTGNVFITGRSQAVRLPLNFRFDTAEVYIGRDSVTEDVLPWDDEVARCYGEVCVALAAKGINLSDFGMMIAVHAIISLHTLVNPDKAFAPLRGRLKLEVW